MREHYPSDDREMAKMVLGKDDPTPDETAVVAANRGRCENLHAMAAELTAMLDGTEPTKATVMVMAKMLRAVLLSHLEHFGPMDQDELMRTVAYLRPIALARQVDAPDGQQLAELMDLYAQCMFGGGVTEAFKASKLGVEEATVDDIAIPENAVDEFKRRLDAKELVTAMALANVRAGKYVTRKGKARRRKTDTTPDRPVS